MVFLAEQFLEVLEPIDSTIEVYLVYQIVGHLDVLKLGLNL